MEQERKKTQFSVSEELCIGCGLCVTACPMKILEIQEGICIITDPFRCLECGTCMRECPQDAIFIEGISDAAKKSDTQQSAQKTAESAAASPEGGIAFTPILDILLEEIADIDREQMLEYKGVDIRPLNDFVLEGNRCFTRAYSADKLHKIGVSSMNFYGSMRADVLVISPAPEYDFPYYVMDWDESEDHIFFICDLLPCDDCGRNLDYLHRYLYEPLEEAYMNYSTMSGLRPSMFYWVRALHSPYLITGTIDKRTPGSVDMLKNCAIDYLKAWLSIYRDARPCDPESDYMKLIAQRRKNITALYSENDPGKGSLDKFLGEELGEVSISIIEP